MIVFVGPVDYRTGYGINTCQKILGLIRRGHEVFVRPVNLIDHDSSAVPGAIHERIIHFSNHPSAWEILVSPPGSMAPTVGKKTILCTTLETECTPPAFDQIAGLCDGIIVPPSWNRSTLVASGIRMPIEVCPESIDESFKPRNHHKHDLFTFGTAGRIHHDDGDRKGIATAVDAFLQAFPLDNSVRLKIKIGGHDPWPKLPEDSRIELCRSDLTLDGMVDWMQSLDCYVNASKGEAWRRHIHEAMACGLLIVSTLYGGVCEYLDSRCCIVVPHVIEQAQGGYAFGKWGVPSTAYLVKAMVEARKMNAARRAVVTGMARARAASFNMDHAALCLENALIGFGVLEPIKKKPHAKPAVPEDIIVQFYRDREPIRKRQLPR